MTPVMQHAPGHDAARSVAVVDIGSNSIRLVIYDGIGRTPAVRFNEKVMCALGRGLERTGMLSEQGIASALATLKRFGKLTTAMGIGTLDVCATEASRSASNGPAFIAQAEEALGVPIDILSGAQEAYYTALGVCGGFHLPDGIVGDLGGGSLEFARLQRGRPGPNVSLPLGTLRLGDRFKTDLAPARRYIDQKLAEIEPQLAPATGRDFYIVGGGWRAIARVRLAMLNAPLRVVHGFAMSRSEAQRFTKELGTYDLGTLADIPGVPRKRVDTLLAALVLLERSVRAIKPRRVIFSAFGLREGRLMRHLSPELLDADPLLVEAAELGREWNRDPAIGEALIRWTDSLFTHEQPEYRRLRHAVCHLADLGWRDHPDARAHMILVQASQMPLLALDHAERAFIAFALYMRYDGRLEDPVVTPILTLLSPQERVQAERLGRALTLGFRLSGAVASLLGRASIHQERNGIVLNLPEDGSMPSGEVVEQRLRLLTRAMGVANARVV